MSDTDELPSDLPELVSVPATDDDDDSSYVDNGSENEPGESDNSSTESEGTGPTMPAYLALKQLILQLREKLKEVEEDRDVMFNTILQMEHTNDEMVDKIAKHETDIDVLRNQLRRVRFAAGNRQHFNESRARRDASFFDAVRRRFGSILENDHDFILKLDPHHLIFFSNLLDLPVVREQT